MKRPAATSAKQRRRRAGLFSAELVLTLPILAIVLAGLFEFTLLFAARGELVEAARTGARQAALPGASIEHVESAVRQVLPARLHDQTEIFVDPGQRPGDVVTVALSTRMSAAAPDLLWPIGYSLRNRNLYEVRRMIRE